MSDSSRWFEVFETINRRLFFVISIISGFTAIYLIQRHSHSSIGSYRHILTCMILVNILFTIINSLAQLRVHVEGHWVILAGVEGIDSETLSLLSIHSLVFAFFHNLLLITAQIAHRWLIICRKISTHHSLSSALSLGVLAHLVLLGWMGLWVSSVISTTQCIRKINDKVYEIVHHDLEDYSAGYPRVGCEDFMDHLETEHDLAHASFLAIRFEEWDYKEELWKPSQRFIVLLGLLCVGLLISLLLIIQFTLLILRRVRRDLRYVDRNDHTQIVRALVLQAAIPCALLHIPLFTAASLTLIDPEFDELFKMLPFTTAWFPVLQFQSMALISSVQSYRRALQRICLRTDEAASPSFVPPEASSSIAFGYQSNSQIPTRTRI